MAMDEHASTEQDAGASDASTTDAVPDDDEDVDGSAPPDVDESSSAHDDRSTAVDGDRSTLAEDDPVGVVGEALSLSYDSRGDPVVECDRIDVPPGEITALVGPNGSGKSTLLKAMGRQLAPDDGVVHLDGTDVESFGQKEFARRLGLLSQENEGPNNVSVEELVYHGRYPYRGFFDGVDEADVTAVERALSLAGVQDLREMPVGDLSGGQRQLVWIAMVLAQETDVLLLDEPTTYLDLHHQLRVMNVIERLNDEEGVTVVVVLHDIAQAARFADYLVALKDGEPYDWGPPMDVVTEAMVADVFDVDATVSVGVDGPIVTPRRALDRE